MIQGMADLQDRQNGGNGVQVRDPRGLFKPGGPGGPGRPKGCENKATADAKRIKREILASWPRYGPKAIEHVVTERPGDYLRLVVSLLPKDDDRSETGVGLRGVRELVLRACEIGVRLDSVEPADARRLRWGMIVGPLGALGVIAVVAQAPPQTQPSRQRTLKVEEISTQRLRLIDGKGRSCGELSTKNGASFLDLVSPEHKTHARCLVNSDGAGFSILDADGEGRIALGYRKEGSNAVIAVLGKDRRMNGKEARTSWEMTAGGDTGAKLRLVENGRSTIEFLPGGFLTGPTLTFKTAPQQPQAEVAAPTSTPTSMPLETDADIAAWIHEILGVPRLILGLSSDGSPSITLHDENGKRRTDLSVAQDGGAGLFLLDQSGTIVEQGKLRLALVLWSDGSPEVLLRDKQGQGRAALGVQNLVTEKTGATEKTAVSSLILYDKEGHLLWRAP